MERTTSQGVDREELIEWYLEQKENELTSVDDLDDEREIIGKALTRLVKDKYLMELRGAVGDSIGDETMEASSTEHAQVHYVVRKSCYSPRTIAFPDSDFLTPILRLQIPRSTHRISRRPMPSRRSCSIAVVCGATLPGMTGMQPANVDFRCIPHYGYDGLCFCPVMTYRIVSYNSVRMLSHGA